MLFSKRPSPTSTITSPVPISTSPLPTATTTITTTKDTTSPIGTDDNPATALLYARVHGVVLAGFVWSVWCCDHYQQDPLITLPLLLTGLFSFVWWCRCQSLAESSLIPQLLSQSSSSSPPSKLAEGLPTNHSRITEQEQGREGRGCTLDVSGVSTWSHLPTSASASSIVTASVSACLVSCDITVSIVAQDNNNSNSRNEMGVSMPPTPTDPPPPYSHNSNNNRASASKSGTEDGLDSGQCMQSDNERSKQRQQQHQQKTTKHSHFEHQELSFSRQRLLVHVWGAGACLVSLVAWAVVTQLEPLLLPIVEARAAMLELELGLEGMEVSFSVCCWVIVVFFWALYALAACYLMSWSSTLVDGSGSGTRTSTEKSEQLSKEVFLVIKKEEHEQELGLELELEHKEQDCKEHEEQQEFSGNVDVEAGEGLREIGQEMDGAQLQHQKDQQQQSVVKVPSQSILRRSISCRANHLTPSSYKNSNTTTTVTIKRHQQGLAPNRAWKKSILLLQHVKHEVQIWSFSLWVLAPTIPRSFGHHHQNQHHYHHSSSQDVKGAKGDVGHEGHHLQQYGRVNKQERGHLLTTAGFLNMDKAECELVRTEETAENAGFLATGGVATKAEGEDQSRAQSNELTGNDQDIFPFVEKQPSFAETHHRYQLPRAPQRTDYMSQSMPDLHAVKRTGAIESTLARWSRMTLDPERLGSIFQYYLRQRASTLKKERQTDEGEQYSTATSDYNFQGGNNNDDVDDVDDFEESEEGPGVTFVIRSSTLPTVRVGLYGADQKRLWTSSGSVHLTPLPEDDEGVPAVSAGHE